MLSNAVIAEAVAELVEEQSEWAQLKADQVVAQLAKVAFVKHGRLHAWGENGDPCIDLTATTRPRSSLPDFTCEDYKEGRGKDAREVRKLRIKTGATRLRSRLSL